MEMIDGTRKRSGQGLSKGKGRRAAKTARRKTRLYTIRRRRHTLENKLRRVERHYAKNPNDHTAQSAVTRIKNEL